MNEIGRAIQTHAEANGFGVVRAFVGHGIGETFHTAPRSPTTTTPGLDGHAARDGLHHRAHDHDGRWRHRLWDDDWTAVTADCRRTAQFEHTLLITDDGADVLTLCPEGQWSGDAGTPTVTPDPPTLARPPWPAPPSVLGGNRACPGTPIPTQKAELPEGAAEAAARIVECHRAGFSPRFMNLDEALRAVGGNAQQGLLAHAGKCCRWAAGRS